MKAIPAPASPNSLAPGKSISSCCRPAAGDGFAPRCSVQLPPKSFMMPHARCGPKRIARTEALQIIPTGGPSSARSIRSRRLASHSLRGRTRRGLRRRRPSDARRASRRIRPERYFDLEFAAFLPIKRARRSPTCRRKPARISKWHRNRQHTGRGPPRRRSPNADIVLIGRGALPHFAGRLRSHAYAIVRDMPCPVLSV